VDATAEILAQLKEARSRGTIVSSGTGSGKTLAFYLPALTFISNAVTSEAWTKALAIYPRNELLKDQLTETLRATRRLNATLRKANRTPIRLGAYFGDTPISNTMLGWEPGARKAHSWTCGFLRCPECDGPLEWTEADMTQAVEKLRCLQRSCQAVVTSDEFTITRQSMQVAPPDIVFTTTEMLNHHMGDSWSCHIFGIGQRAHRKPRLVLLDEVHTYDGTSGAQVAYLLRRWRHAVKGPVVFVGLSATLREAGSFFSQLTGLPERAVVAIEPSADALLTEGMEYLLALRGDPVSGASLLSTTIQTAMLLRRSLDAPDSLVSEGAFGTRLFLFTDDLDVTNRLFNDTLDAEGLTRYGTLRPGAPLAALRSPALPQRLARLLAGQSWDMCEEIGFGLDAFRARVGRTSSQDKGVDLTSDIVIATASLEVGFNDAAVGAVIQHKAPRGTAQFLQRKGRAGRTRGMRPWTVVVLSDYGRDRLAYQGYDLLFDPNLEPRSLPLGNRYVQRMQATYALLDWFGEELGDVARGSIWTDLSGPSKSGKAASYARERQSRELELVDKLLQDPAELARFARFLGDALQIGSDVVDELLWDPPRAVLTAVVPTIRRRLATQWRSAVPGRAHDYAIARQPLPDFVPPNLFSDLNLPEVDITVPLPGIGEPATETMPIVRALREFAPGRVSYRFGVGSSAARHWVAPADLGGPPDQALDVLAFIPSYEGLGDFEYWGDNGVTVAVPCFRPWAIRTTIPDPMIADSSNSYLNWRTQIRPHGQAAIVEVPRMPGWREVVESIHFYLHVHHSGVELRRFATGTNAALAFQDGRRVDTKVHFVAAQSAGGHKADAAVGFAVDVDSLVVNMSGELFERMSVASLSEAELRSLRSAYFQYCVLASPVLAQCTNGFERNWLHQLYLSAITAEAMSSGSSLADAHELILRAGLGKSLREVLDVIFQALPTDESYTGDGHRAPPPAGGSGRIYDRLVELCDSAQVQAGIVAVAPVAWEQPNAEWWIWAKRRLRATLGAAVVDAIQRLCPDVDAGTGLVVDLDPGPLQGRGVDNAAIWLSETTPGGGGVLERVFARYAEDPRRFFRLVESALRPSDFELVDSELSRILEWSGTDAGVGRCLQGVRMAADQSSLQREFGALVACLQARGAFTCHAVVAALNARVLRPAASAATDRFTDALVRRWRSEEERLGVEIDARVFAYVCKDDRALDAALGAEGVTAPADAPAWRFSAVYSLLWPRGWVVRAQALALYNPFAELPTTDSRLLRELLPASAARVELRRGGGYPSEAVSALIEDGVVAVAAPAVEPELLRRAILSSMATPVDVDYLHLYPRLASVERSPEGISVHLELGDAPQ
jgi:hypothetical protein